VGVRAGMAMGVRVGTRRVTNLRKSEIPIRFLRYPRSYVRFFEVCLRFFEETFCLA